MRIPFKLHRPLLFICAAIVCIRAKTDSYRFDSETFIGRSRDGSLFATEKTVGYDGGMDRNDFHWSVVYAVVRNACVATDSMFYKISEKGTPDTSEYTRKKLQQYYKAQPQEEWLACKKLHSFEKGNARAVSPDGRWKPFIAIKGSSVSLDGEEAFNHETKVNETGYWFYFPEIVPMRTTGKWSVIYGVTDGSEDVEAVREELISTSGSAKGKFTGTLFAYWGPKNQTVAIERYWEGIIFGSGCDVLFCRMQPCLKK